MKNTLNFLLETNKLKEMKRRGWVINRLKDPETIAEHIFRASLMGWILGEKKGGFDIEKLMKIAISHDLCEVYAGDATPYDSVLPNNNRDLEELMKTWPRFSNEEKKKQQKEKHEKEKSSLESLTESLSPSLKNEIREYWMDYERKITPEGRFFNQADRMENFLQAYEYWEKYKKPPLDPWWIWAREFFDDPLLLEFMEVLELRFHKNEIPDALKESYRIIKFFNDICCLKRKPRRGWVIHEIEGSETTAEHIYHLTLFVWVMGHERKEVNMERALKMSLVHDICEVNGPDFTPYDAASLSEQKEVTEEEIKSIKPVNARPTETQREKMERIKRKKKEESIANTISNLEGKIKEEISELWREFRDKNTPEGNFVHQCNYAVSFLQAMQYHQRYDRINKDLWLKRSKEVVKDSEIRNFIDTVKDNIK